MLNRRIEVKLIAVVVVVCFLLLGAVMAVFTVPALRAMAGLPVKEDDDVAAKPKSGAAKLIYNADGKPGLALTKAGINGLEIKPVPAKRAINPRPLPPQVGTINFDNETLFPFHPDSPEKSRRSSRFTIRRILTIQAPLRSPRSAHCATAIASSKATCCASFIARSSERPRPHWSMPYAVCS